MQSRTAGRTSEGPRYPVRLLALGWIGFVVAAWAVSVACWELKLADTTVMASGAVVALAAATCLARGSWGLAVDRNWHTAWGVLFAITQIVVLLALTLAWLAILAMTGGSYR